MKRITCLHCDETFTGETKEDVQMKMLPHYKLSHAEVMAKNTAETKEDWFREFDRRWDAA